MESLQDNLKNNKTIIIIILIVAIFYFISQSSTIREWRNSSSQSWEKLGNFTKFVCSLIILGMLYYIFTYKRQA
jgi:uncharacterized membrane protein